MLHPSLSSRAAALGAAMLLTAAAPAMAAPAAPKVTQFSLEQLMELEVSSVSKKVESFFKAPSAIFVIDQEDIRRSGASSVQELLGMVPGMEVSQIDNNKWAITSRGFNGRFSNKLQILLDGRSLYLPTFSGVFWEVQDLMFEDIERIEVIRGPGGTLWGANAVNGVINIISKKAADTQGTLMSLGAGTEEGSAAVRHGVKLGNNAWLRLYAKETNRDGTVGYPSANDLDTDSNLGRSGFRLDWDKNTHDRFTLQGDSHRGQYTERANHVLTSAPYAETVNDGSDLRGANLIGRWHQTQSPDSETTLQFYYDHDRRRGDTIGQEINTFDLDFQHQWRIHKRHDLVWGLGYRSNQDSINNLQPLQLAFIPDSRRTNLCSAFIQDEITLVEGLLRFTVGTKVEHNDYTGYEVQPNARLTWTPSPDQTLWAAVSRAVRTPSRGDTQFRVGLYAVPTFVPPFLPEVHTARGSENFDAETLLASEMGYRFKPGDHLFVDLTAFANQYDHLLTQEAGAPIAHGTYTEIPTYFANNMEGEVYGIELAATWQPVEWWQVKAACNHLWIQLQTKPDSSDTSSENNEEKGSPQNQLSLRSMINLPHNIEFDAWLRYVDSVPRPSGYTSGGNVGVESYVALDFRLGWKASENLELSLVGKNLLDPYHLEYVAEDSVPSEIERSIYGKATWSF
ncbi:MAG: TonB-dependent receptor [Thermodesulfobacteriota bacterium]